MMGSVPLVVVKEMLFRATPISAQWAYEVGIANYVLPVEQLEARTFELAQDMLANSSLVIALLKEEMHVLAAQALTVEIFERIQALRRIIYDSDDYKEGIRSFFEKRKPVFQESNRRRSRTGWFLVATRTRRSQNGFPRGLPVIDKFQVSRDRIASGNLVVSLKAPW